ncbi:MAG TPA: right-handed parallel beta-helix repeat-containing protein [Longimicrobiales bacterium]|nr:right-handed parallel beta-helix repeat-containing protein [Longimicrobiales bacterium]
MHRIPIFVVLSLITACAPETGDVRVAPPTGDPEADRGAVLAALEVAAPGTTVRFAPGRYRLGGPVQVTTPGLTLQGDPEGTVLESCDPAALDDFPTSAMSCDALELVGGLQTVRGMTFEGSWHGVVVGCCQPRTMAELGTFMTEEPPDPGPGGAVIQNNVFRGVSTAVRVLTLNDSTVVRDNLFEDVGHAISINGNDIRFEDNSVVVVDPTRVPVYGGPLTAVALSPRQPGGCRSNVVARNRIEGYPQAVGIQVATAGADCRDNVVEGNTIVVAPVLYRRPLPSLEVGDPADSSFVDVPILLVDLLPPPDDDEEARITGTRIEQNHVVGARGLAIELDGASRSWIMGNAIEGVERRDPFPGNTDRVLRWGVANGAAIWVSYGSRQNDILDNVFEGVAGPSIYLQGRDNRVRVQNVGEVTNRGEGNRIEPGEVGG